MFMEPPELTLPVGGTASAAVSVINLDTDEVIELLVTNDLRYNDASLNGTDSASAAGYEFSRSEWDGTAPFGATRTGHAAATISCSAPTNGVLANAYRVLIPPTDFAFNQDADKFVIDVFGALDLFGVYPAASVRLAGDGTCTGDETATPEVSSTSESGDSAGGNGTGPNGRPRQSGNSVYPVRVSGTSGSTGINTDDCFTDDGPTSCVPEIDFAAARWTWADGAPNLLLFGVKLGVPLLDGSGTRRIIMTLQSEGSLRTRVTLVGGEMTCEFEDINGDPAEPLPGESCEINGDDEVVVVREISDLATTAITISMASSTTPEGGETVSDEVQVIGIERP